MEFLIRIIVGVGAAWIVPDPAPQQSHPSGYELLLGRPLRDTAVNEAEAPARKERLP